MPVERQPSRRAATASKKQLHKRRDRVAQIVEAYPQTEVTNAHDKEHRSYEVAGKRLGYYLEEHFGDDGRSGVALKAPPGAQELLVDEDPDRYWVPAFVGRHGWIGVRLDLEEPDWDEVEDFVRDAWLLTAPKKLAREFEASESGAKR